jgi:hypothetical protein
MKKTVLLFMILVAVLTADIQGQRFRRRASAKRYWMHRNHITINTQPRISYEIRYIDYDFGALKIYQKRFSSIEEVNELIKSKYKNRWLICWVFERKYIRLSRWNKTITYEVVRFRNLNGKWWFNI